MQGSKDSVGDQNITYEWKEESLDELTRIGLEREATATVTTQPTLETAEIQTTETRVTRTHHTQVYKVRFQAPVVVDQHGRQTRTTSALEIHDNEYERLRQLSPTAQQTARLPKNKDKEK
jgi:hypothetical protein